MASHKPEIHSLLLHLLGGSQKTVNDPVHKPAELARC